jgi:hypothetical protein
MHEKNRLQEMILSHWQQHLPRRVEELRKSHQLEQAISEAEARTADLLYELLSVKKMEYQAAWELATREWAFPPTEAPQESSSDSTASPSAKRSHPATSG